MSKKNNTNTAAAVENIVVEAVEVCAAPVAKSSFRDRFNAARLEFSTRIRASWDKTVAGISAVLGYVKVAAVAAIMTFLVLATIGFSMRANASDRRAAAYRQAGAIVAAAAEAEAMAAKAQLSAALAPKPTISQRIYSAGESVGTAVSNLDGRVSSLAFGEGSK
jgi:hypothetical protein